MQLSKSVATPVKQGIKLSIQQSAKTEQEFREMDVIPYASAVASLMYSMVCCRPDITYAMSLISRFMVNPGKIHWEAVKWVLKYINGTINK